MNRRELFSFLPLAPVLVGAAIADEANKDHKPENAVPTLSLQQTTGGREALPVHSDNRLTFNPTFYSTNRVDLSVGKDGKLWIRSTGEDWKRVVTE